MGIETYIQTAAFFATAIASIIFGFATLRSKKRKERSSADICEAESKLTQAKTQQQIEHMRAEHDKRTLQDVFDEMEDARKKMHQMAKTISTQNEDFIKLHQQLIEVKKTAAENEINITQLTKLYNISRCDLLACLVREPPLNNTKL